MESRKLNIAVVGLGLIGGSLAMKSKSLGHRVLGVDFNAEHCKEAEALGLVDEILELNEALQQADLIALCVPVKAISKALPSILDQLNDDQYVFDVGSTKNNICKSISQHPNRAQFVAAHPLAGTEFSGPKAAFGNLFDGKKNIICEAELSDPQALKVVSGLFEALGMQNLFMKAEAHDRHMAYVSHLSHVTSFTLGLTVLDIEKDEKQIFNLASTGLASTVRLAKSSPITWGSIFEDNAENLSAALEKYIDYISAFKKAIDQKDLSQMQEMMSRANEMRRVLAGMELKAV